MNAIEEAIEQLKSEIALRQEALKSLWALQGQWPKEKAQGGPAVC